MPRQVGLRFILTSVSGKSKTFFLNKVTDNSIDDVFFFFFFFFFHSFIIKPSIWCNMHIRPTKYLRSVKTVFRALMSCLKVQKECGMDTRQTDR